MRIAVGDGGEIKKQRAEKERDTYVQAAEVIRSGRERKGTTDLKERNEGSDGNRKKKRVIIRASRSGRIE